MKQLLVTGLLSLCAFPLWAQIKTTEIEVRNATSTDINEIMGQTRIDGDLELRSGSGAELNLLNTGSGKQWQVVSGYNGGFEIGYVNEGWIDGLAPFFIGIDGEVGIGTTSPLGLLHLVSDANANARLIIDMKASSGNTGIDLRSNNIAGGSYWIKTAGNDANDTFVVRGDGAVGIGTDSPAGRLHIHSSSTGGSANSNYDNLIIEQTAANVGLTLLSRNNQNGGISFSDNDASNRGTILYGHGDDRMAFYTAGTERARILANGNFGIGTGSAKEKLDVNGAARIGTGVGIMKIDAVFNEQANNYVRGSLVSSRDGDLEWNKNADVWTLGSGSSSNDFTAILHTNPGELQFFTGRAGSFTSLDNTAFRNAFQRMTINGDGKVGIGTRTPGARLEVKSANQQLRLTDSDDNKHWQLSSSSKALAFRYQEGESDERLAMWLTENGYVGINTTTPQDWLSIGSNHGVKLSVGNSSWSETTILRTHWESGLGDYTELHVPSNAANSAFIRLMKSGHLGIGVTNPSQVLHVNGNVLANNVSVSSDRRWKKNINAIEEASATLNNINPVSYELRKDEFPEKDFDESVHYGVIAQELERVLPELVSTDLEGFKSVDYQGMIGLLIKGFQERGERIEQLEQALAEKTNELEVRLAKLEQAYTGNQQGQNKTEQSTSEQ